MRIARRVQVLVPGDCVKFRVPGGCSHTRRPSDTLKAQAMSLDFLLLVSRVLDLSLALVKERWDISFGVEYPPDFDVGFVGDVEN